jgi:membrane protein DedA with SNARE-associated domain
VLGIQHWLSDLPPLLIYVIVGVVVLIESMGVPLPGEIVLVSAALLAASGVGSPVGVAIGASAGAIIGDSIGYLIGHRGGRPLLVRLGRRFPRHFGPDELERAERIFNRWGVWAVFFGRFVALLRILAGPLAGALRVPYRKFFAANASGGIIWATGTTVVVYSLGVAAEAWLERFSWVALIVVVLFGIATTLLLRRRASRLRSAETPTHTPSQRRDSPADRPL